MKAIYLYFFMHGQPFMGEMSLKFEMYKRNMYINYYQFYVCGRMLKQTTTCFCFSLQTI